MKLVLTIGFKVVQNGGAAEYDAIVAIYDKPKTPTARVAAMYAVFRFPFIWGSYVIFSTAMGATYDRELWQKTLELTKAQARDQDMPYFFRGLVGNMRLRRKLVDYFKEEYETVSALDWDECGRLTHL